jgi:glutathione synthase/RimK-type ligase-like ATP-grasp enzyme
VDAVRRSPLTRVEVVSYRDFLTDRCRKVPTGCLVRLESPSECDETTRAILQAGREPLAAVGRAPLTDCKVERLECGRGEMLYPRQWYFGFREVLRRIAEAWSDEDIAWASTPAAIATMFDKRACLELWSQAGLPVPHRFPGIESYAQLRSEIQRHHARIFVKLRYGYSAVGAVALEWRGPLVRAITTMEMQASAGRPRLFVSKRPQVLRREAEIAALIDRLAEEEIVVEAWLSKARYRGKPYDLRVVMIGGQVQHVVGRANSSPFTNLNLDGERVPREAIENQLAESWPELAAICQGAATGLPNAGLVGLDVLVHPGGREFSLLEANAFGDYLPGLTHRGLSTYEAQLVHWNACLRQEAVA